MYKNIIATLFLLLFTATQISVVHEFAHEDDAQECIICIAAQDFQSQSFDLSHEIEFPTRLDVVVGKDDVVEFAFAKAELQPRIHTTRPPPFATYL